MRAILKSIKDKILNPAPKIKEVAYKWSQPLKYTLKPTMIVYHHTADDNLTPEQIDAMHKKRGWAGIGYHFYIRKDGTIYRGRPENAVGAHAPGVNDKAFGIAVEGNLNNEKLTPQQMKSLIALSRYLMKKYNIKDLKRHKDVKPTTECPGANFPFEEIKTKLKDLL
ncbi:N-acetylmuramoyl-L-alanine amidase [Clostridium cavendishii DSM 21758]|uniref:N-acetylmuramoyl-L-alanine amidase n=1 Tax=Clostridium cavendishii DSM 21758 TaxID=1121302 RepID=A0A1M6KWI2_9CLOT|nr:peptidoglycan recognition family protein [Clostridium cavendishii]SHJ63335.1 N-acetylmuramoyl-L-alanine amidase [Clostridium cavendishii DSM 21758]